MNTSIATALLESIALVLASTVTLAWQMRESGNLPWHLRKLGLALTGGSIALFLAAEFAVVFWLFGHEDLPAYVHTGVEFGVLALVPFLIFMAVIYQETKHHAA